jgi:hypothetical protein
VNHFNIAAEVLQRRRLPQVVTHIVVDGAAHFLHRPQFSR